MRAFKVIALSVGATNKIYSSGETVHENNFPEGHVDELVAKGFLEEIKVGVTEEDLKGVEEVEEVEESILDSIPEIEDIEENEFEGKTHTSFSLAALKKKCTERGIEFNDSDTRKVLFGLLVGE